MVVIGWKRREELYKRERVVGETAEGRQWHWLARKSTHNSFVPAVIDRGKET